MGEITSKQNLLSPSETGLTVQIRRSSSMIEQVFSSLFRFLKPVRSLKIRSNQIFNCMKTNTNEMIIKLINFGLNLMMNLKRKSIKEKGEHKEAFWNGIVRDPYLYTNWFFSLR